MELKLSKQPVGISETVYDSTVEQPLECDVLLPDYCPDIQKILRCEVVLALLACNVEGDRLKLDGMAAAHLYYVDEEGCLRHAEYKIPYAKVIELRGAPQGPVVEVTQNVDYFNCRAVSARRLDMRGAVSIQSRVTGQSEEQIVSGATGMGIQLRSETLESVRMLPSSSRQAELREDLELGYGKPPIGEILRVSATARVTDYKVITGKIVTKGEATVRVLYRCEEEAAKLEMMEYTLPVSQVVDLEGLEETCDCGVWYDVCTVEAQPKRGGDGENRMVTLHLTLSAMARASKPVTFDAACDCYSTECEVRQVQKQVPFLQLLGHIAETCGVKETMEGEELMNVIDLWCAASSISTRVEADTATVSGRLQMCVFAANREEKIVYQEQTREFTQKISLPKACDSAVFTPRVTVESVSFAMSGAHPEVRCNLGIAGELYNRCTRQVLCDIEADPSRKKNRRENLLYLYYPAEQESLWEIAKRYNTSVEAIRKSNAAEQSAGGKTMLLIPMQ